MRRLCVFVLAAVSFFSCEVEILEVPVEETCTSANVQFRLETMEMTRSSISPNEMKINDVNLYAFRNGILVDDVYATVASDAVLTLPTGYSYNIYAVANMGYLPSIVREDAFVENLSYAIDDVSMLNIGLPMSCVGRNVYIARTTKVVNLQLKRCAAKIQLSIDKASLLEGLQVESVLLCQSAGVLRPFRWEKKGGSRVLGGSETLAGDYATDADLACLNAGESVFFYALENCQGILLPDNTDPLAKTPEMLGVKENLCTYLQVDCSFADGALFEGAVGYRIYLGLDSTSSFDVPGNSCINVSLMLTDNGLQEVSWKVDADVSVRDGYVSGSILKGMHQMNDLYVGEKMLYEVEFEDELYDYLRGDVSGCSLAFVQNGEVSDAIEVAGDQVDDRILMVELKCCRPAEGGLYLYSRTGELLGCLDENAKIQVPQMICSECSIWMDDDPVEPLTYMPECEVNGSAAEFYVYLVDKAGYNLNGCRAYAFDASLFDFRPVDAKCGEEHVPGVYAEFTRPEENLMGSAAAIVNVFSDNDGEDHSVNVLLSDIYSCMQPIAVDIGESNFSVCREVFIGLEIPKISLTLVDNGWAKYHDCQLSMIVDNPSNLPLEVSAWQLMSTNKDYGGVDRDYVENNLTFDRISYVTGEFYNGAPVLYGSSASFVSERNEYGSQALSNGKLLVYPLTGISSDDLWKAMYYDKVGNHQMIHSFDVVIGGHEIRSDDIVLVDSVSNGSAQYDYIYYHQEGWNYRGAELLSCGNLISSSVALMYDYPNVSAGALDGMFDRYESFGPASLLFGYDSDKECVMLSENSGNYVIDMGVGYSGVVDGYVQTYPKGTWYSAQDNYCSVDVDHEVAGISLDATASFVVADDGKLKDAIDEIYQFSFMDSPKPLGSDAYLHRAHPVNLNLNVSPIVRGALKNELLPVVIGWNFNKIDFWHQQDNMNYKCALNAENKVFTFVRVGRK